jgi:hypothetical protein
MVGQPGINCCSILDNFRKKTLGAYYPLLEPAPTSALFAGLLENSFRSLQKGASAFILPPYSFNRQLCARNILPCNIGQGWNE